MGSGHDVFDRYDGTDGVAGVGDADDLGARAEHFLEAIEQERARLISGHRADFSASFFGNHLPRHDIGVMLKSSDEDFVARLEVGTAPT